MGIINKKISLVGTLIILSGIAHLTYATGDGLYVGLQVGLGNLHNPNAKVNTGISNDVPLVPALPPLPPFPAGQLFCGTAADPTGCITVSDVAPKNSGLAERLFIGGNINQYAGIELGVSNYTSSEYSPDLDNSHQPNIREYSLDILGKLMYPIGRFTVFGKLGIGVVYQSTSPALIISEDDEDSSSGSVFAVPAFGAGISFDITPNWVIDVSANRIQKSDNLKNIDFYALGLSYHWVQEYCGQFLC